MGKRSKSWPRNSKALGFEDFKDAYDCYRKVFGINEPIPSFENLNEERKQKIKSAIHAVKLRLNKGKCEPGAEAAAFYLFYISESHFLVNGNKRASVIGMITYLKLNDRFVSVHWRDIYKLAKKAAKASPDRRERVISEIREIIATNLVLYEVGIEEEIMDTIFDYQENLNGGFSSRADFQESRDEAMGSWNSNFN